jgi:tricorn protease
VSHIYPSDPDIPGEVAPLAQPGVGVSVGDVIVAIDGVATLSVGDPGVLLRNSAGKQVLLRVVAGEGGARARARAGASAPSGRPPGGAAAAAERLRDAGGSSAPASASAGERDVVVTPISLARERELRYDAWEYTRRLAVDSMSGGRIGYVHLRAMGGGNMAEWVREYYPVANRDALIIDVRHNNGGNIDSWLLGKLLRREWFWWQPRVGEPYHNMPYAFRGPIVVLVNERTASDGEAFAEGFRRLGLGKVIGTRTWGGEIWLSSNNFLADRGIATAAEQGVFADGKWLIEGWGVDPDVVVDNLPVESGRGRDAQLEKAIEVLRAEMAAGGGKAVVRPRYPGGN